MRTVLVLASDFAPSSLPPALRIRFFARYLPEFGWKPIIISAESRFYDWGIDKENERLIPDGLTVLRTKAMKPAVARRFGFGDIGLRSFRQAWRTACRVCIEQKVDATFISVPPYVPMVLGRLINRRFGIPYVIDYIDPWVTEYYWRLPRRQRPPKWPLAYALSRLLEPLALRNVSGIVGVSKATTDSVKKLYPWMRDVPVAEIPYGGEPADLEYLRAHPRPQSVFDPGDGLYHISYVGVCGPQYHAAVRAVFEAVSIGLKRDPQQFARLRLHFVGSSYAPPSRPATPRIFEMASEMGISQLVDERPSRVSYLEALQLLLHSQALLLVGSEEPHYTASKVFPYILARRPLIAVFHEASTVVDILKCTTAARVVTFDRSQPPVSKAEMISQHIHEMLTAGSESIVFDDADFEKYTTRMMAARLAAFFDGVIPADSRTQVRSRLEPVLQRVDQDAS